MFAYLNKFIKGGVFTLLLPDCLSSSVIKSTCCWEVFQVGQENFM